MNKELTKEEAEEYFNKLWLENKELIQENMGKLCSERFELELELVDKNKEIERLKEINKELGRDYSSANNGYLRLHSIIKEVREYIENHSITNMEWWITGQQKIECKFMDNANPQELLEILKGENNE